MKKYLLTLITLFITFCICSQTSKNVSGIVIDNSTQKRIVGARITPPFHNINYESNEKGKFKIVMPDNYFDTIIFTHADYYPYVKKITRGSNFKINFIPMVSRSMEIDTFYYCIYDENRLLSGEIFDDYKDEPLKDAIVSLENNQKLTYTNPSGKFSVGIPRSTKQVIISHPDFQPKIISVKKNRRDIRSIGVKLIRVKFRENDTLWKSYKNIIAIVINELATGSIGIRYQRFLKLNHAVGLHTSTYLYGYFPAFFSQGSKFKGIKVAPYYRYYMLRSMKKGAFVEGKIITGYFDFDQLFYAYPHDNRYGAKIHEYFWSYGLGLSVGLSTMLPHRENAFFTISAGYQFFQMNVPKTVESKNYGTLEVQNFWWYFAGAGSFVEIKVAFGGIF